MNNLAWMLALQGGKGSEALSLINQAIELDGERPSLLDTRALVNLSMGHGDAAIRDLEDALAASPGAVMYFHLARAYLAAGRRNDADGALQKAKALGLTRETLHPLERTSYTQLLNDLARR